MSSSDMGLGDRLTLKQLAHALQNGFSPIVEVESMDGIYAVRFHHANGVADLCSAEGKVSTFLGTGEIRDVLGQLGLTHGVLTFADQCGDEMIGVEGKAITPTEKLTYGTRIAFR
ncbi:hypothetical protein LCGC14_0149550 [marine sediment metagenome]|uniref:Uncharacterized protein n=1 Tax=marine sediment metagenome TaxID=412755 RepID=A0A0F9V270_9ZZZZ|nr:hypothetical protein [Halomonas sp.]HDZ48012.1 hypothetical protein [Halomonas sp.]HEB07071.1 hypothetical protein [Halomonas sp.]